MRYTATWRKTMLIHENRLFAIWTNLKDSMLSKRSHCMTLLEKANIMTKLEVQSRLVAAWNQE